MRPFEFFISFFLYFFKYHTHIKCLLIIFILTPASNYPRDFLHHVSIPTSCPPFITFHLFISIFNWLCPVSAVHMHTGHGHPLGNTQSFSDHTPKEKGLFLPQRPVTVNSFSSRSGGLRKLPQDWNF